jgi:hypothetical protein
MLNAESGMLNAESLKRKAESWSGTNENIDFSLFNTKRD